MDFKQLVMNEVDTKYQETSKGTTDKPFAKKLIPVYILFALIIFVGVGIFIRINPVTEIRVIAPPNADFILYDTDLEDINFQIQARHVVGGWQNVELSNAQVSGYSSTRIGAQTITVTYENKTTTFQVALVPVDLNVPKIQVISGTIKIEYDTKYTERLVLDINGTEYTEKPISTYTLPESFDAGTYTIKVKSVNQNKYVNDSDFSEPITFTKLQPVQSIEIVEGKLIFDSSSESDTYDIYIDGAVFTTIHQNEFDLNSIKKEGQHSVSIVVRAKNNTAGINSNPSEPLSYTMLSNSVTLSVNEGYLTWTPIANASGYELYAAGKLVSKYNVDIPTLDIMSFYSETGSVSFSVKVLGDGNEYINSVLSPTYTHTFTEQYIPLRTVEDLNKMNNSNERFILINDIDLSAISNWTPIENFGGYLFGNNKVIKNLTIRASNSNIGFFSTLSGKVSNLKLANVNIEIQGGYENIGAICGVTTGSINGCEVTGLIKAIKCTNVGGIVGQVSSNNGGISDCKNVASVEGLDNVGGVAGHIYTLLSFAFISNENTGIVSGNNYVGGLLGCVAPRGSGSSGSGDLVIKKCVNNGKVTGNDYIGGMAGSFSGTSAHLGFGFYYTITSSMSDNANNATITGRDYVGGLAGYTGDSANSISNCYNNADITGNYYVGGYVGYSSRAEITDAENKNKVSGKAYVGGIVGVGYSLKNCTNNGVVESTGVFLSENLLLSCTGGIAGQANFVHGCVNNKDVIVRTNGYYVGGIVGIIKSDAIINMDGNKNHGNVAGYSYVGGFAGAISSQPGQGYYEGTLVISNVLNSGNISATTKYAGGITGYVEGAYRHYGFGNCKNVTYQISFCTNTGYISGTANVGGIAGKIGEHVVTVRSY